MLGSCWSSGRKIYTWRGNAGGCGRQTPRSTAQHDTHNASLLVFQPVFSQRWGDASADEQKVNKMLHIEKTKERRRGAIELGTNKQDCTLLDEVQRFKLAHKT